MAKNYIYNLLLTLANLLFPIFSFPYVSRVLGPEGIGKAQFVFSFAQYFALMASIGVPIYGMKEIARFKDNPAGRYKVFSELISIHFLSSILLTCVYLGIVFTFPYFNINREMYLGAMILVLLNFCYTDWVYTGMEEFKSIALRSVLFKAIGLLLMYLLIKNRGDYQLYLYIMMFSFLGNNVLSLLLLKSKVRFQISNLQLRKHVVPLMFILGTTLATSMYTEMDTVLLGFLSNSKTVGLYTAAVKLSKISIPFVISMSTVMLPKIAKQFGDNNLAGVQEILDQAFGFLMFFGVPIVAGLVLLAPEFIALFSGHEFLPAANSMRVLALLPLIIGFGNIFLCLILIPAGKNRQMFVCVLGGVLTSVLLNIILIPSLQVMGSSIANVSSEIVVTLFYVYYIRKYYRFKYQWSLAIKSVGSALVFLPVLWALKQMHLPLAYMLILSVAVCSFAYFAMQTFVFRNSFVHGVLSLIKAKMNPAAARASN